MSDGTKLVFIHGWLASFIPFGISLRNPRTCTVFLFQLLSTFQIQVSFFWGVLFPSLICNVIGVRPGCFIVHPSSKHLFGYLLQQAQTSKRGREHQTILFPPLRRFVRENILKLMCLSIETSRKSWPTIDDNVVSSGRHAIGWHR